MNVALVLYRLLQGHFGQEATLPHGQIAAAARPPQLRTMRVRTVMLLEDRALQLRVLRGWVWITRDGCTADTVLGAGDFFEQRPGARVLVQALEEADLSIAGATTSAQNVQSAPFTRS